jgi:hypothetical protein
MKIYVEGDLVTPRYRGRLWGKMFSARGDYRYPSPGHFGVFESRTLMDWPGARSTSTLAQAVGAGGIVSLGGDDFDRQALGPQHGPSTLFLLGEALRHSELSAFWGGKGAEDRNG